MSHGDQVTSVPSGFRVTALTDDALNAFEDTGRQIFAVQFHPEVAHTPLGAQLLRNFLFSICNCKGDWSPKAVIQEQVERIRETVVIQAGWFAVFRVVSTQLWLPHWYTKRLVIVRPVFLWTTVCCEKASLKQRLLCWINGCI